MKQMKKAFLILVLILLLSFSAYAQTLPRLCKKHSLGLKGGFHWYPNSDFFNDYLISKDRFNSSAFEIEYEYNYNDRIGLSFPVGAYIGSEKSNFYGETRNNIKIKNHYLAPTVKYYFPLKCESVFGFAGVGFDLYDTRIKYENFGNQVPEVNESKFNVGFHASLGIEVNFHDESCIFNYGWPVSIFIETRFVWAEQEKIDQTFASKVNSELGDVLPTGLKAHDLDVGGNLLFIGIKYYF